MMRVISRRDSRRQNAGTILSFAIPTKHFCMFCAFHDFHFVATTHEVFENYTKFSDFRFFLSPTSTGLRLFLIWTQRKKNENGRKFAFLLFPRVLAPYDMKKRS
jgi:hypothetical protein